MKKIILASVSILGVILLLILAAIGLVNLAVVNQPVGKASAPLEKLPTNTEWIKVGIDERMFTLFAALNAAGYDKENFGEAYHPVRELVRERLAGKTFSGQSRLRQELKLIGVYNFVVWALHYGGPPDFVRQEKAWAENGASALFFFGMDQVLRDFYREMDIHSLWQDVKQQYEQEAARYQSAAGQAVQEALTYTRLKDVPVGQIVVIPNLMDAHWSGFGPQIGDTAYVVVGPTGDKPDVGLVQHEALHSLIGPLVEANLDAVDPQQAKGLFAALRPRIPSGYDNWETLLEESVVRALNARLAGPEWEENSLRNDEQAGLLLVRPLAAKLKVYEASTATLGEFMPELLRALNEVDPQSFGAGK